jgi:undecaprenyl-diphosphatase
VRRDAPAAASRAGAGLALLGASWWALRSPAVQRADVRAGEALRHGAATRPEAATHRLGEAGGLRAHAAAPACAVDRVVMATTDLGSVYAVVAMGAVLALTGRRGLAADVLGVGLAGWAVSQAAKTGVNRARPYERDGTRRLLAAPAGSSFPSGHATVATAWSTLAAERAGAPSARASLALVGAYVAATRVHAGVHYPSDVVGGMGMGLALSAAWRGPLAQAARGVLAAAATASRSLGAIATARRRVT